MNNSYLDHKMAYILKVRATAVWTGSSCAQRRLVIYPVYNLCFANPVVPQSSPLQNSHPKGSSQMLVDDPVFVTSLITGGVIHTLIIYYHH